MTPETIAEEKVALPNKGGRPSKYCPALVESICASVRDGIPLVHAATIAGACPQTIYSFRKQFPDFDEKIKAAISDSIRLRLGVIRKAMESKDENVSLRAATWWLTHVPGAAEHFAESRRMEITGPNGEPPIQIVAVAIDAAKI